MLRLLMFLLAQTMWGQSGETTQQPDGSLHEGWRYLSLVLTTTCSAVVLQASRRAALSFGVYTLWVLADHRRVLLDC